MRFLNLKILVIYPGLYGFLLLLQRTISGIGTMGMVVEIVMYLDIIAAQTHIVSKSIYERDFFSFHIYLTVLR